MLPNFTGAWQLIHGESDFGFLAPPEWHLDTITHEDPQARIRTRQKDATGDVTVDRDLTVGQEPMKIMIRGRERQIIAFWQAAVLVLETRSEVSGNGRRIEDRRSMDAGGAWLITKRLHEQPGGAVRQRLRLRRQIQQEGKHQDRPTSI